MHKPSSAAINDKEKKESFATFFFGLFCYCNYGSTFRRNSKRTVNLTFSSDIAVNTVCHDSDLLHQTSLVARLRSRCIGMTRWPGCWLAGRKLPCRGGYRAVWVRFRSRWCLSAERLWCHKAANANVRRRCRCASVGRITWRYQVHKYIEYLYLYISMQGEIKNEPKTWQNDREITSRTIRTGRESRAHRVAAFVWKPARSASLPTGDLSSRRNLYLVLLDSSVLW